MEIAISELEAAWDRVRDNEGCAGADGVTIGRFGAALQTNLRRLQGHLRDDTYRPLPLLRIVVEKKPGSGATRQLLIPAVRDRVFQTALARLLSSSFEDEFIESSFAYRPSRGVDRAIARVIQLRDLGYTWVVDADITSYFDEVPHELLLKRIGLENTGADAEEQIRLFLNADIWDGHNLYPMRKGLPQGSPLSPLLSNLFLQDFDIEVGKRDWHLVRYADDFLALCASETDAHAALEFAGQWMQAHGLGLHADKTRITQFKEGFSFLGVYFVDEQAYTPWKQKRATGRVIAMARPMPPPVLARYLAPAPDAPPFQRSLRRAARLLAGERDADFAAGDAEGRISVAFLYLTEQGSVLRKSGDRFLVEKDGTVLLDLPYHKLESVLIFGNVQITTQSLGELLEKGIGVSFLSRTGRFRGTLSSPQGKDIPLRMEQFRRFSDSAAALKLARTTIGAKIGNYVEVLRSYHEGAEAPEREGMEGLAARLTDAKELESLLGIEGSATRVYFEAVMKFNKSGMEWTGRARHPAPDPVNALLSLAYTLLASELTGVVEAHGLDNYLGYMHQMDYGRPSLALDLMEGFRGPVADRFVLTQINRRVFRAEEFQPHGESGGLRLTPEALVRFLEAWERWMLTPPVSRKDSGGVLPSFRRELRRDVERFVRHLRGESDWDGWRWDRVETAEEKACDTLSATT